MCHRGRLRCIHWPRSLANAPCSANASGYWHTRPERSPFLKIETTVHNFLSYQVIPSSKLSPFVKALHMSYIMLQMHLRKLHGSTGNSACPPPPAVASYSHRRQSSMSPKSHPTPPHLSTSSLSVTGGPPKGPTSTSHPP